jgi:SHS2 domain-containing protein
MHAAISGADEGAGYFEHGADIGLIGRGASVERAFEAAARAMFAIMVEGGADAAHEPIAASIEFAEDDIELALVRWLNALLAAAREQRGVFSEFRLARDGGFWRGEARGVRWRADDARGTEVKGATLTALAVRPANGGWEARCVVDV